MVWTRPLRWPRAGWRRTGHDRRAGVRDDLRSHGPDLDADVRARSVRSDRARDHLLESRIRRSSPHLQIVREVISYAALGYCSPLAIAAVPHIGVFATHFKAEGYGLLL